MPGTVERPSDSSWPAPLTRTWSHLWAADTRRVLTDGPLRAVDDEQAEEIGRRLVQMVDQGL